MEAISKKIGRSNRRKHCMEGRSKSIAQKLTSCFNLHRTHMWLPFCHVMTGIVEKELVLLLPNQEDGEGDIVELLHLGEH